MPAHSLDVRRPLDRLGAVHAFERVAATLALVALAPLWAAVATVIVILSRRSPLVCHMRVGRRAEPLPMLKFRTMWNPSEAPGRWLPIERVSGEIPSSKSQCDERIPSRFAAFCRRCSLDELPQLYHVVRGEMSLVGPRPITRRELDEHYAGCQEEVLSCRPGITGLWQVMGRNRLTYAQRRRLDLLFARKASPRMYFVILMRSVPAVLGGKGAF